MCVCVCVCVCVSVCVYLCEGSHGAAGLLGLGQPQPLGVVLPLVVSLCHGRGAEGGVAQLTVVVLCGQDHPSGPFERQWHWLAREEEGGRQGRRGKKMLMLS